MTLIAATPGKPGAAGAEILGAPPDLAAAFVMRWRDA